MYAEIDNYFYAPEMVRSVGRPRQRNTLGQGFEERIASILHLYSLHNVKRKLIWECCREAHRQLVPRHQRRAGKVPVAMIEEIGRYAIKLLADYGLNEDQPQEERDAQLICAILKLFHSYDTDRAVGEYRFTIEDMRYAHTKVGEMLGAAGLDQLIANAAQYGIKLIRSQMQFLLALAWIGASKDILTNAGAVPVVSIEGFFRHWGFHCRNSVA